MGWEISRPRGAFTLVELLTVIAIVGILAAILVPTISGVMQKGKQAAGMSTLRGIGSAVILFANDNSGRLPGGVWPGQMAYYQPGAGGRLVNVLSEYMGYTLPDEAQVIEAFGPPAYWDAVAGYPDETRVYVINEVIAVGSENYRPFGDMPPPGGGPPGGGAPGGGPSGRPPPPPPGMRMSRVLELFPDAWALSDCDRQHPGVAGKGWANETLPEPFHGKTRNVLFWDGHVEAVPLDELELGGSPGGGPGGGPG